MKRSAEFFLFPALILMIGLLVLYGLKSRGGALRSAPPNWPKWVQIDPPKLLYDARLTNLKGTEIFLHETFDQWALLNFWRTDCAPCKREMPLLEKLHQGYSARGLKVIGINKGESAEQVEQFLRENPVSFPIYLDLEEHLSKIFDIYVVPSSFLVRPDKYIIASVFGIQKWMDDDFRAYVNYLLRNTEQQKATTQQEYERFR